MSLTQLNPPLPLETPKGRGWAHAVIDYSQEHDLLWMVFLNEGGECWCFPNSDIRMVNNFSLGRYVPDYQSYRSFGSGNPSWQHNPAMVDQYNGREAAKETTEGT
jgi:hypothetical protein